MPYFVNEPVVQMRESPLKNAKVVSQAIFGEEIQIEDYSSDWIYLRTPDGYKGWALFDSFAGSEGVNEAGKGDAEKVTQFAAHLYNRPELEIGPLKTIPYGSKVRVLEKDDPKWVKILLPDGEEGFIQKGDIAPETPVQDKKDLVPFSMRFLGTPYTWGGRSSLGFDCSGFVQMLYSRLGIFLPRDSRDQIECEKLTEIPFEKLEPGDLIFFGKEEDVIGHVGLYIGKGEMIHASAKENKPYLRISSLSDLEWSGTPQSIYPFRTARKPFF